MSSFCIVPLLAVLASVTTGAVSYEHYLLSCGGSENVASTPSVWDGRTWYSDNNSTFSDTFSATIQANITNTDEPWSTARVFRSNFTYTFPVSPGPKFIRLFFNPSQSPYISSSPAHTHSGFSAVNSYLTVEANSDHLLLFNFSSYLNSNNSDYFFREFYVQVTGPQLQLTVSPTSTSTYAFLNGIEVVSIPENLYVGSPSPKNVAYQNLEFPLSLDTALETVYRLNVGGRDLNPSEDNSSMYRRWLVDDPYLMTGFGLTGVHNDQTPSMRIKYTAGVPSYSAPAEVYRTFRSMGMFSNDIKLRNNVTWGFEVDLGFYYLLRLHWCEVLVDINGSYYRVFDVYINYQMAEPGVDIYGWVGGRYIPIYRDYVVRMDHKEGIGSRGVLQLAMHPNTGSNFWYYDILLNGLEIFKINRSDGSLNATNLSRAKLPIVRATSSPQRSSFHILPVIIGVISGALGLSIFLCYLFILGRWKLSKMPPGSSGTNSRKSKRLQSSGKSGRTKRSGGGSSSLPSHLCRYFSLAEIKVATSDFSDSLIIGHGGFGNVYKGTVISEDGPITVAIKRLNPLSNQGAREFKMEIELLSKLRHLHLVSLIGYCDSSGEMILVYEYMSNGTLRDHLYPHNKITNAHLPWLRRLQICVGAARGLHYLHTSTDRMVIHRDVKSTNILIDERWVAKVSDFGLSKLGPAGGDLVSHVSTAVKGSFGYVDPEYYRRQQLTEKSDVYSFGVVLFEVLCGRAAVNPNLPKEQVNLRIWARRNHLTGTLNTIVDPTLLGQIATECLRKFGDVAESCVRDEGVLRPSMADVIGGLELALQLQLEALVPNNINQLSSRTTKTSATDQGVTDDNTLDEDYQVATTNITSPTTDASVRLIRSPGESTWTSVNNSSRLFSSTTSEAYGGSPEVFSQIFKADGR